MRRGWKDLRLLFKRTALESLRLERDVDLSCNPASGGTRFTHSGPGNAFNKLINCGFELLDIPRLLHLTFQNGIGKNNFHILMPLFSVFSSSPSPRSWAALASRRHVRITRPRTYRKKPRKNASRRLHTTRNGIELI
jgi:hypothetical protein